MLLLVLVTQLGEPVLVVADEATSFTGPVRALSGPEQPTKVRPTRPPRRHESTRQTRPQRKRLARNVARRVEHVKKRDRRSYSDAVAFALGQVGEPYVWGADGPGAWDCSGLVVVAYRRYARLPHQTEAMLHSRRIIRVPRDQLRRGDLVWPNDGHVAIYLGRGRIVHAANPQDGVRIDHLYGFVAGGRVVTR